MSDVDDLCGLNRGCFPRGGELAGADHLPVLAGDANGVAAVAVDQADNLFVDGTPQYHFHHIHGGAVGDAHAVDNFALDVQLGQYITNLCAAAMVYNGVHAYQFHEHDVLGRTVLQLFVHHAVAGTFNDVRSVGKALNIRQRFGEHLGDIHGAVASEGHGRFLTINT